MALLLVPDLDLTLLLMVIDKRLQKYMFRCVWLFCCELPSLIHVWSMSAVHHSLTGNIVFIATVNSHWNDIKNKVPPFSAFVYLWSPPSSACPDETVVLWVLCVCFSNICRTERPESAVTWVKVYVMTKINL